MNNENARDAKRIIYCNRFALIFTPHKNLVDVARGWAKEYRIPKPVMLRAMARWARLNK